MTRATSNKIRLCDDPLIYSVDSPGVMVPFLGYTDESRERAVKISLICQSALASFLNQPPSRTSLGELN